mmetsp:Transcript_75478/g.164664  ORF Transcript_75478/g.164664 Transcript_75478/m.164664 type:complete len:226 (-) Transcript_75478:409-1086(-)
MLLVLLLSSLSLSVGRTRSRTVAARLLSSPAPQVETALCRLGLCGVIAAFMTVSREGRLATSSPASEGASSSFSVALWIKGRKAGGAAAIVFGSTQGFEKRRNFPRAALTFGSTRWSCFWWFVEEVSSSGSPNMEGRGRVGDVDRAFTLKMPPPSSNCSRSAAVSGSVKSSGALDKKIGAVFRPMLGFLETMLGGAAGFSGDPTSLVDGLLLCPGNLGLPGLLGL